MEFSFENYINFLGNRFGIDITAEEYDSRFSELGIDSLAIFAVVSDMEDYFNIKISSTDLFSLDSPLKFYTAIVENKFDGERVCLLNQNF